MSEYKTSVTRSLKQHKKAVHLNIKDKHCDLCEFKTSQAGNLAMHRKGVHGNFTNKHCDTRGIPDKAKSKNRRTKKNQPGMRRKMVKIL